MISLRARRRFPKIACGFSRQSLVVALCLLLSAVAYAEERPSDRPTSPRTAPVTIQERDGNASSDDAAAGPSTRATPMVDDSGLKPRIRVERVAPSNVRPPVIREGTGSGTTRDDTGLGTTRDNAGSGSARDNVGSGTTRETGGSRSGNEPAPAAISSDPEQTTAEPETSLETSTLEAPSPTISTETTREVPAQGQDTENGPKIIQRGGGLINQAMPTAPRPASVETALSPLRQILLVAQDMPTAEKQRKTVLQQGLSIVSRKKLSAIGLILSTFQVPEDINIDELLGLLQIRFPDARAEKNQRFRLLETPGRGVDTHTFAQTMVGLRIPSQCRQASNLAMLDSAVSGELLSAYGERLRLHDVTRSDMPPNDHGSAIASLLISDTMDYPGLLPAATLDVINVFAKDENGEPETRTDWLLYGFNRLAELSPSPQAVNLSFGGHHSALLERVLHGLSKKMLLIAAAGNDGSDVPVYPAADDNVYAVGAVDARGRLTRSSNRGRHVVLLAPGEDIWTRDGTGQGFYASGTSFAAPFVTAALALLSHHDLTVVEYIGALGAENIISFRDLCP